VHRPCSFADGPYATGIDEVNVHDVLEKGLNDLMDMCDVVIEKFDAARDRFKSQASSP
jgi:DNA-directed RNA polymerase I and III subunit RPAC2